MPEPERFEALILGSGNGGMFLATHLARSGQRTAVVERRWDRRLLPQHQLSPKQERNIECESRRSGFWWRRSRTTCKSGANVSITMRTSSDERAIEGSDILVAAGRVPNTAGIGLEAAGVELDPRIATESGRKQKPTTVK